MGAFGIKIPTRVRRPRAVVRELCEGDGDGDVEGRLADRAAVGAPVHRPAAAAQALRHRRAEEEVLPAAGQGRDLARSRSPKSTPGSDPANMHAHAEPTRGRQALHPQRREALVHQRHARRAVRRHGADAGRRRERQAAQADHRVHRRGELARRRGRASLPLHGTQGDRERRHSLHERARAAREHPLGRGEGTQARADHAQHRPPHAAGERRRRQQGAARGVAHVGQRARAVGRADRQARGGRAEDRA